MIAPWSRSVGMQVELLSVASPRIPLWGEVQPLNHGVVSGSLN